MDQATFDLPASANEELFREAQSAQLASAQDGTDHPGAYMQGDAAPAPEHQSGTYGRQFSDAALESLKLLDGPSYNKWPV
jgi:hypothetical protein